MATTAEARDAASVVSLQPESAEQRTASYFISVRDQSSQLETFLRAMPKGADLHTHASGAIYAESWDDDLHSLREKLLTGGLADVVANARRALDAAEAAKQVHLGCATPAAEAGCGVEIHYLREAHRNFVPAQVFAELLVGFELAMVDPRVVGVNLIGREDTTSALRDIDLHMSMLDYLHSVYPTVPISLHAGELQPRLVAPVDNCCHVRLAVERGRASRVGHGVDILSEQDPGGLMGEMANAGVVVEIMLTSNAQILGVQGQNQPLTRVPARGRARGARHR